MGCEGFRSGADLAGCPPKCARLLKQTSVVAHARSKPRRASTDLHGQDAPSKTSNDSSASIHLIGTPRSSLQHTRGQRWVWACREWPSGLRRRGHLRKGIGRHEFCSATAMQRRPGSFSHSATQPLGHRVHRDDFCDFARLVRLLPLARKELYLPLYLPLYHGSSPLV